MVWLWEHVATSRIVNYKMIFFIYLRKLLVCERMVSYHGYNTWSEHQENQNNIKHKTSCTVMVWLSLQNKKRRIKLFCT